MFKFANMTFQEFYEDELDKEKFNSLLEFQNAIESKFEGFGDDVSQHEDLPTQASYVIEFITEYLQQKFEELAKNLFVPK